MVTPVEGYRIQEERKANDRAAADLSKNAQSSVDFSDDPLFVEAGYGSASGMAVPWWIWLVVAVVGYQVIKK